MGNPFYALNLYNISDREEYLAYSIIKATFFDIVNRPFIKRIKGSK